MTEQNLTVENGYPIQDFNQGRNGQELDMQEVNARFYGIGLELASAAGQAAQYTTLYGQLVANGSHPEVAYQTALDVLGIEWRQDTFFVTDKNETIEI